MIKKVVSVALLTKIYRMVKRGFRHHPYYKAGIIDNNGQKIDAEQMTDKQKNEISHYDEFTYQILSIVDKYPLIKFALLSGLIKSLFLKESSYSGASIGRIDDGMGSSTVVIIDENTSSDPFYADNNSVLIYTSEGPFVVDRSVVEQVEIGEDMNVTTGVDMSPSKMISKIMKRKGVYSRSEIEDLVFGKK